MDAMLISGPAAAPPGRGGADASVSSHDSLRGEGPPTSSPSFGALLAKATAGDSEAPDAGADVEAMIPAVDSSPRPDDAGRRGDGAEPASPNGLERAFRTHVDGEGEPPTDAAQHADVWVDASILVAAGVLGVVVPGAPPPTEEAPPVDPGAHPAPPPSPEAPVAGAVLDAVSIGRIVDHGTAPRGDDRGLSHAEATPASYAFEARHLAPQQASFPRAELDRRAPPPAAAVPADPSIDPESTVPHDLAAAADGDSRVAGEDVPALGPDLAKGTEGTRTQGPGIAVSEARTAAVPTVTASDPPVGAEGSPSELPAPAGADGDAASLVALQAPEAASGPRGAATSALHAAVTAALQQALKDGPPGRRTREEAPAGPAADHPAQAVPAPRPSNHESKPDAQIPPVEAGVPLPVGAAEGETHEAPLPGGWSGPGRGAFEAGPTAPPAPATLVVPGHATGSTTAPFPASPTRGDGIMMPGMPVVPEFGPYGGEPHEQLIRAVRLQWQQGVGDARVRLRPEHLGEVAIELRVERGVVTVSLRAETTAAAESMRTHDAELRAALDAHGLRVERFEVVVDPDGRRRRQQTPDLPEPPAYRRRPRPDLPRFEVVV
jgi:hypothetical protein